MKLRFCYKIHKDVGLAYDSRTGGNTSTFTEIHVQLEKPISDEAYKTAHEEHFLNMLATQFNIAPFLIKPISTEEYDKENDKGEICYEKNS